MAKETVIGFGVEKIKADKKEDKTSKKADKKEDKTSE